jgi:hypothetical protein
LIGSDHSRLESYKNRTKFLGQERTGEKNLTGEKNFESTVYQT